MERKRKVLVAFLLSNIAIVLIPLLVFTVTYWGLLREVREDIAAVTEQQIIQAQRLVENQLVSAYKQSAFLSQDQDILNFAMKHTLTPLDMYNARSLCDEFSGYKAANSSLSMLGIYFRNSDTIITNDAIYALEDFYPGFFAYGDLSAEAWRESCLASYSAGEFLPLAPVTYRSHGFTGSLYHKTIGGSNNLATILMVFDNGGIAEAMRPLMRQLDGWSYVQDGDGRLLAATDGMDNIDIFQQHGMSPSLGASRVGDYYVYTSGMFMPDWRLVSVMSMDQVFFRSNQLLIGVSLLCLLVVCVGFAVSFLFARSFAKPVHRVFSAIGSMPAAGTRRINVYKDMEAGVRRLADRNDALQSQVDEQSSELKRKFLQQLVLGQLKTEKDLLREAALADFALSGELCRVAVFRFPAHGKELLPDTVKLDGLHNNLDRLPIEALVLDVDNQDCLLLLKDTREEPGMAEALSLLLQWARSIASEAIIAVGNPYPLGLEISRSRDEAMETIAFLESTAQSGIWMYADMPVQRDFFSYPSKTEADLTRYVRTGNMEIANSILNEIIAENTRNRMLSSRMKRQLISELCGTAIRLAEPVIQTGSKESTAFHALMGQAEKMDDLVSVQSLLHTAFAQICEQYSKRMRSHNTDLISNIMQYIGEKYTDDALGLQMVSDAFKINENYLSTFFKEQTGKNFAAYVEQLRIERATALLCEGEMPIEGVAEAVGYASQHTFRRAFKKLMHLSPSEYRKQYQKTQQGE